ncbi:type IV secretory system conjugative DNA transfer family protein, partial [Phaeobacter piscinae]|uniref:type IV secretory system conjugative DNA transfer family protein n=1 Tax=Phaeobacter piscinae TaxID=1580596 RepID=UPI0039F6B899
DAFGGVVSGVGGSMLGKHEEERSAVISTAIEQTAFLNSPPMRRHLAARGLPSLRVLKHKPTTIFLVLPASKMATHFRWLRLVITQAMAALEGEKNKTGRDVLFILEEFPTLGYMRQVEAAAGLMAGYNVKLWTVMQDLSQIQALYPKSWETFLGNAGIVEAFGNTDSVTLEYLSKRLGTTWAVQRQPENLTLQAKASGQPHEREQIISVPLMASYEIAQAFARDKGNKLVMVAGEKPFALKRIFWKDMIRGRT